MADLAWVGDYGLSPAQMPEIAGCYDGLLVVCGDAACVWDDLDRLGCRRDEGEGGLKVGVDYMAVNAVGMFLPAILEHWYSNDAAWLARLAGCRRPDLVQRFGWATAVHSFRPFRGMHHWPWPGAGTSSLNAALTGVALGYERIVLCGVPLDDGPNNGMPAWRRRNFVRECPDNAPGDGNRQWLDAARRAFRGRVFSMSGRTREWLGEPGFKL